MEAQTFWMVAQTMILGRYFLRRWSWPLLGSLLFYGGLLILNEMINISKEIFSQGAHLRWMFPLLATALPEVLGMVLPMAAVLGGLLGTQQMMADSELVAAQGTGVGRRIFIKPWLLLSSILLFVGLFNAHALVPKMSQVQQEIRKSMIQEAKIRFLKPGSPPWYPEGSKSSALWVSPTNQMHLMEWNPKSVQHLTANSFSWSHSDLESANWALKIQLNDIQGVVHQIESGSLLHIRQATQELVFPIPNPFRLLPPTPVRYRSTHELLALKTRIAWLELSRRFSIPLAAVSMLLLGIALGFGHSRFYRGGAVLRSLGVILAYYISLKYFENMWIEEKLQSVYPLFCLPGVFLLAGIIWFRSKTKPHRILPVLRALGDWVRHLGARWNHLWRPTASLVQNQAFKSLQSLHTKGRSVLDLWASYQWFRNWLSVFMSLMMLDLLIEYANLAGDLIKHQQSPGLFLQYWLWNLPPFFSVALPVSFLMGSLLSLAESAASGEWLALRAGGIGLLRYFWSSARAWGSVLLVTLLVQLWMAPFAFARANALYSQILNRSERRQQIRPWLYLSSTGTLWFLRDQERWGFPLQRPKEAPILLYWKLGQPLTQALEWGQMQFVSGPRAEDLFPDRSLRETSHAEEASTRDLLLWQKWAPDPERGLLLWTRLLGWLAGPCLVLALLGQALPHAREGRGRTLGYGLIGGLIFIGIQNLFLGAAKAGEIPSLWGVLAPLLLLLSLSLTQLRRIRT